MDKKKFLIGFLCIFIYMSTYIYTKADTIPISFGEELVDYITLGSMSIALTEGAELSWADLDLGDALLTSEEKARRMLYYYRTKAWDLEKKGLLGILDFLASDVNTTQSSAIGFTMDSGISEYSTSSIYTQLSDRELSLSPSSGGIVLNLDKDDVAYWNRYNTLYPNNYLDSVNYYYYDNTAPRPNPDESYEMYLSNINEVTSDGFFWANFPLTYQFSGYDFVFKNGIQNMTWVTYSAAENYHIVGSTESNQMFASNMTSIYITSNNGVYSFSQRFYNNFVIDAYLRGNLVAADQYIRVKLSKNGDITYLSYTTSSDYVEFSKTGTLAEVLQYINNKVRNAFIYVDGVLWASPYTGIHYDKFEATFPNALIDNSTEDGKIVAAPIFWAVDENTGQFIDNYDVNLDKLLNSIIDKIDNNATSISITDLLSDGVIEKDGAAIGTGTGVIAGSRSLADVIAQARSVPGTLTSAITLEDVIAGEIPALPILPEMGSNPGFTGVTVLARIINVANQSLPTELITVFWGVVFGAVILGIIKILHK